ncbi:hypothetical protein ACRRTK_001522 [Alexandromys fortis]
MVGSLEPEQLQVTWSHLMWSLGLELGSFTRAIRTYPLPTEPSLWHLEVFFFFIFPSFLILPSKYIFLKWKNGVT